MNLLKSKNSSFLFKSEKYYISIILIGLIVIFSHHVIFYDQYYNGNDFLYKRVPWNNYPPTEFGNYNRLLEDQAMNWDSSLRYFKSKLSEGQFPILWITNSFTGSAFDAIQLFSPLTYIHHFLPFSISFKIVVMIKLFIAGIATYYFLRELKCSKAGSLISAISFMFSGAIILNIATNSTSTTAMMFPIVFLFVHRIVYKTSWKNFIFLSLAFGGLLISGHIETTVLFLYFTLFYFIFLFLLKIKETKNFRIKITTYFFGSFGLGLSLVLVHLLPFAQNLLGSSVWIERTIRPPKPALAYSDMITNFLPDFFGNPTFAEWDFGYHKVNFNHVGIIPIFLMFVASIFLFRKYHQVKIFSFIAFLLFGYQYDLFGIKDLFQLLPTLSLITPALSGIVLAFFISVLAGFGTHYLTNEFVLKKRTAIISVSIMAVFIIIGVIFTFQLLDNPNFGFYYIYDNPLANALLTNPPEIYYKSLKSELIFFLIISIITTIFVLLKIFNKISKRIFVILLIFVAVFSSLEFSMFYNPTSTTYEAPTTPSIEFLQADNSLHRILPTGTLLPPDSNYNYDIESIRGNRIQKPLLFMDVFLSMGDVRAIVDMIIQDYSSPVLDLMNVKYILINKNEDVKTYDNRYELVFEDKSVKILENKHYLPRAFMVYDIIKTNNDDLPKDWSKYHFLKGWIKGSGNGDNFEIKIYGSTKDNYLKFFVPNNTPEWKEFLIDLKSPEEIAGNLDLSDVSGIKVSTSSENPNFHITELQLTNNLLKLNQANSELFWELKTWKGGNLSCEITKQTSEKTTLRIKINGDKIECTLIHQFNQTINFSNFKILEFWMNEKNNYQVFLFGPTMNDFYRYDVYQYSPKHISKVNVDLENPIQVNGNPDLSNIIQMRIDPKGGRFSGNFIVTYPILHESEPLEILYKRHHSEYLGDHTKNGCNILFLEQKIGKFDPKFASKLPTHQPKDMFFFEKIESQHDNGCSLELIPNYSQTLIELNDSKFDHSKTIIINDEFEGEVETHSKEIPKHDVEVLKYQNNMQEYNILTEKDGFLFVSDTYDPDWNAYLDGEKTEIYRTNWAFRSIFVPEGEHNIEFKYEPTSFFIGSMFSISAALFMGISTIFFWKKKNL